MPEPKLGWTIWYFLRTRISVVGDGAKNWWLEKVGMSREGRRSSSRGAAHSIVANGIESEMIKTYTKLISSQATKLR